MGTKTNRKSIIVTGFPYAFPYYFKVFEHLKNKDDFVFVLPKLWLAKAGKIRINLESKPGFTIYGSKAISYGGHSIRGLFKGWLPGLIFLLPYLKIKYGSRVLYSCSEPNLLATLYNGVIAKCCGLEHILFTWQNVPPEQRMRGVKLKLSNALVHLNLWLADGIICGNEKAADIIRKFKTRAHKTYVLGRALNKSSALVQNPKFKILVSPISGIDTEKFRPGITNNWKQKLDIKPGEKLILFCGALDKRKGLDDLINASYKLSPKERRRLPTGQAAISYKLVIVGTGPEEESLKRQVKSLKLQDKVIFLDWMPNDQLPALLNAADVFVYPSVPSGGWEEQFAHAATEASACGAPVAATHSGSIGEVIKDGEGGILVEPNNPEQLATAIGKILSDSKIAGQMGQFGREYIVANFSFKVVASKIENFLLGFANK